MLKCKPSSLKADCYQKKTKNREIPVITATSLGAILVHRNSWLSFRLQATRCINLPLLLPPTPGNYGSLIRYVLKQRWKFSFALSIWRLKGLITHFEGYVVTFERLFVYCCYFCRLISMDLERFLIVIFLILNAREAQIFLRKHHKKVFWQCISWRFLQLFFFEFVFPGCKVPPM